MEQDKERRDQTGTELERDGGRKENGKTRVAAARGGGARVSVHRQKKFMAGDKQNYHRIVTSTARHVFISLEGSCTTASVVYEARGGAVVEKERKKERKEE